MVEKTGRETQLTEKVLAVNRVTKVTKGGKKLSFSALIVVGDGNGKMGFGYGKANEVSEAIRKGLFDAKKNLFEVTLVGTTIPHEIIGKHGAGKVLLKPAAAGTGVIAGGPIRALCEAAGIKDLLSKCLGSDNVGNVVKAAVKGFKSLRSKETMEATRKEVPGEAGSNTNP